MKFDAKVTDYVPDFHTANYASISEQLKVSDLLSHRSGLVRKDALWLGADNVIVLNKKDTVKIANGQEAKHQPGEAFGYNNLGYAIVAEAIERRIGQTLGTVLEQRIFKPLGLLSTSMIKSKIDPSKATSHYMVSNNRSLFKIGGVGLYDTEFMAAAGGVRSNVDDLLLWAQQIMKKTSKVPMIDTLLEGHTAMSSTEGVDDLYTFGWVKVTTPARFGKIGFNTTLVDDMPVIGTQSNSQTVYYHNGAMPGANNCIIMIPSTESAIVVLTNSTSTGDTADWIAQALLHATIGSEQHISFLSLASEAAHNWRLKHNSMKYELAHKRTYSITAPTNDFLVGTYLHSTGAQYLEVFEEAGQLYSNINGLESQRHRLRHYHNDIFEFLPSHDERLQRGLIQYAVYAWLLHFEISGKTAASGLRWVLDADVPAGELFTRA